MYFTSFGPLVWLLVLPLLLLGLWTTLVDRPRGRMIASFILRCLAILFLILAICKPFVFKGTDRLHVVFLLDVSASVDLTSAQEAAGQVSNAIQQLRPGDTWSLGFAGRELRMLKDVQELEQILEHWHSGNSDDTFRSASRLAEAMLSARSAFPSGKARRMVLLSDGRPTDAPIKQALKQLDQEQVEVRFGKLDGLRQPEAAVVELRPSTSRAFKDEIVRLTTKVAANTKMAGELRIANRGVIVRRKAVQLTPDVPVRIEFDVPMVSAGASVWTAELVPEQDHFLINNAMSCTIEVQGAPRILVLHEKPVLMRDMSRAMQKQGFEIDLRPPSGLPHEIDELLAFDAIMLANISATHMRTQQMTLLKQYVSDFGGGLIMTGSENSFGLGGYYRTPVEDVLPLVSRFEKEKEKPSLAMVLVIDKSGSMQGMPIALARQAAKAAVELLSPQDQIGVIGFDGRAFIAAEMQSASNRDSVHAAIDRIGAGGGTYMYAGMSAAKQMLEQTASRIKHMIVLGDGQSQPADHEGLASQLTEMGVTVSTVALGPGADQALMKQIAEIGRGRYYQTMDPSSVPQIFTRETMQASRSAIKEDLYASVKVSDHAMLLGFETSMLPMSLGFVMTRPKATARVLLATETGDPLLAFSRYGLGSTLAFTSDLTPQWGAEWLAWPQFGKFWSQSLRAIVRQRDVQGLRVETSPERQTLRLDIHATSQDGKPVSDLRLDTQVLDDTGKTRASEVMQVGLGRYVTHIPLEKRQRTTIRVYDEVRDKLRVLHYHQPYDSEYQLAAEMDSNLASLPTFSAGNLRDDLVDVNRHQHVSFVFVFLAILSMLTGLLLRRL